MSCSHKWGVQRHLFLAPPPPKGQISLDIIKFQLLNQFQRLLNQTLWVFSQMKDIKHIRRDFHLAAWVMPQGWDLGVTWGGCWGKKKCFSEIQPDFVYELLTYGTIFWVPAPLGGAKRSNTIKSELQSHFQ